MVGLFLLLIGFLASVVLFASIKPVFGMVFVIIVIVACMVGLFTAIRG